VHFSPKINMKRPKKVHTEQLELGVTPPSFPSTRFQGSKLKISDWIWDNIKDIPFETALDAFGGTSCISYLLKTKFKTVTYNDILKFNSCIGKALIEDKSTTLSDKEIDGLLLKQPGISYQTIIQDNFSDIYYTEEENQWLDIVAKNIYEMEEGYKKNIAYFALFQSCIIKRPYNLFHRKNLYVRTADVERSFGNKSTWDTPFNVCFRKFASEANRAVFDNGKQNKAVNQNVFDLEGQYDLVYIDTPYISKNGVGVDYYDFYHFLEGLVDYPDWTNKIDYESKHKRLKPIKNVWNDKKLIADSFNRLFDKFQDSVIVVSYRSDGIPSVTELEQILSKYKKEIIEISKVDYKYVLSHKECHEILIIAK